MSSGVSDKFGIPDYEFRLVFGRTRIDCEAGKEDSNRLKHKYSLESAAYLLERLLLPIGNHVPYAVSDAFLENGEMRHMHMTVDDNAKVVLMVTTMRENETVRVISFRRAKRVERDQFRDLTGYAER